MPSNTSTPCVAVLIDGDNIQLTHTHISNILKLAEYYGSIVIRRAYGDWKQPPLSSHGESVRKLKVELVQQNRIGKEATDQRILIEVCKLLEINDVDIFIVVSSDGGFAVLYLHIQEQKKKVIGIGSKEHVAKSGDLQKSCTEFFYVEELEDELKKPQKTLPIEKPKQPQKAQPVKKSKPLQPVQLVKKPNPPQKIQPVVSTEPNEFEKLVEQALSQLPHKDGWVYHAQLCQTLRKLAPDFESKLGGKRLATWLKGHKRFERREDLIRMI